MSRHLSFEFTPAEGYNREGVTVQLYDYVTHKHASCAYAKAAVSDVEFMRDAVDFLMDELDEQHCSCYIA